jgi:hypothetical protein
MLTVKAYWSCLQLKITRTQIGSLKGGITGYSKSHILVI